MTSERAELGQRGIGRGVGDAKCEGTYYSTS